MVIIQKKCPNILLNYNLLFNLYDSEDDYYNEVKMK